MNIAIIIPSLTGGGAERAASEIGRFLSKNNNIVYLLLEKESEIVYDIDGQVDYIDVKKERFRLNRANRPYLFNRYLKRCAQELCKLKIKYKIDVSISFMEECNCLNVYTKSKDKKIISVRTKLSSYAAPPLFFSKKIVEKVFSKADEIIAVSEYVKNDLYDNYRIRRGKIEVIPNPAMKHGITEGKEWIYNVPVVLFVGRLDSVKQVDRIIRAFSYTYQRQDAKLLIIGKGRLLDYLQWMTIKMGIGQAVEFIGFVEDVSFFYEHADVFVMASKEEGFPNAMIEAMASGIPIVSTDSPGGCREILGKNRDVLDVEYFEYGIMTPYMKGKAPRNKELTEEEVLLGKALETIIIDNEIGQYYREQSRKRANCYNYNVIMKKWEKLL